MKSIRVNGISIAYQSYGPENGAVVLIIQGVGAALSSEPDPLATALATRGFRVILFDNRDSGASAHLDDAGVPDFAAIAAAASAGKALPIAYTLDDMASDATGLLDALHVSRAHIVGGSSGGMIAQIVAAERPERTASLTLISTTTGNPSLSRGAAPMDFASVDAGTIRQAAATAAAGDLRERIARIVAPTVVVHGADDPVFALAHGQDVAATIPGAELRVVAGMGHEPRARDLGAIVDAIVAAAARGGAGRRTGDVAAAAVRGGRREGE
jgi:pimeloyl-ACP methyl ester carboxylesterase